MSESNLLLRLTSEEREQIDKLRGDLSREEYVHALIWHFTHPRDPALAPDIDRVAAAWALRERRDASEPA